MPGNKPTPSSQQADQKPDQKSTPVPADDAPQREDEDLSMFLGDAKSENAATQAPEYVNKDKPDDAGSKADAATGKNDNKPATPGAGNKDKDPA